MKDNLYINKSAQKKLISGIKKCRDAIGSTMGSGGSNGLLEAIENPGYLHTNDGITLLEGIHLADPLEDMGRKILLESVSRANKQSGDGSSTTTVLTAALIEEGSKFSFTNPMTIKRSLERCVPEIEKIIASLTREIMVDEVGQVAAISAEDKEIGRIIQEIYQEIGKDGIIHWDISKTYEDHYTLGKGITVEGAGFASPYMADLDEKTGAFHKEAKWKNPHILITKQKITSAADFNTLFETLFKKDIKEVVVFCDEFEANVVADLVKTRAVRGFKTLLVKMPLLWKDWWYEDLAKATGATVIDPVLGLALKDATIEHLGKVENITVDKDNTYLDGIKDVSAHIAVLEAEGTDDGLIRASRLNTKTARYFVGAPSESALSYKRLKVEDAIGASYQALHGGVVIGGGLALMEVAKQIKHPILSKALLAPYKQITKNLGHSLSQEQMEAEQVYDPAPVVLNAVKNAISVAASVLTCSVVVQFPRPTEAEQLIHALMQKP